jgi:exonuclease VII large subunit
MANYLTQQDAIDYGPDVLDLTQRAALHAVSPKLQQLEQQNASLQRQLAKEARHRMDQAVEAAIPNYREIDKDARWHRWLLGIDDLTGRVRQTLLDDAIQKGSSYRAIEFFRRFLQEAAGGTSQTYSSTTNRQTRSYGGAPVYTRKTIAQLYEQHRKGAWAGREAEWAQIEADIFRAQRESRVQDTPYLTK